MIARPTILRMPNLCCVALAFLAFISLSSLSFADELISKGTNSRQAKKQALNSIPYNKLKPETRNKIAAVVDNPSIYRRLPITSIDVDPDMFLFLVRYPEVVVNIWQIMGVTQMNVDRTGPFSMKSDDGVGAVSDVELVYGTNDRHIFYATGNYSGPLIKRKLNGQAVMILKTNYVLGPNGKPKATNSLDVFVKVENATVNLIAKTLNPLVGPTADHNFVETLKFVQRLNETTEQNGVGVQRMADRLQNIDGSVRTKFTEIAGLVYERNSQLSQANTYAKPAIQRTSDNASQIQSTVPVNNPAVQKSGIRKTGFFDFRNRVRFHR